VVFGRANKVGRTHSSAAAAMQAVRKFHTSRLGGVLFESGLEVGEASLIALDQRPDSGLSSGRDLLPEFVRKRRVRIHAAGLSIKLRLGNCDA
jgi:hypothetical protein